MDFSCENRDKLCSYGLLCMNLRGGVDVDWCMLRGVIIGHTPICESSIYHLVEVCWPPIRGNLVPPGDAYPQIDLCCMSGVILLVVTYVFGACHAEGPTQQQSAS